MLIIMPGILVQGFSGMVETALTIGDFSYL